MDLKLCSNVKLMISLVAIIKYIAFYKYVLCIINITKQKMKRNETVYLSQTKPY